MSIKDRINEDLKASMRARDARRLGAIRLLMAEIKQKEIDGRCQLDDEAVLRVIDKMLKQRRDSITQFAAAGRDDLVAAESFEAELLTAYLPAALSDAEIDAAIMQAIADIGAVGVGEMGKVMTALKGALAGRADMADVSRRVKNRLVCA
ncbi:MAG TPA: GatB/YqeY domain-containing protein [Accumulibacter sp.]|nr:GatB/YqeY domain-containing protein [Accumulibacter sp.]